MKFRMTIGQCRMNAEARIPNARCSDVRNWEFELHWSLDIGDLSFTA